MTGPTGPENYGIPEDTLELHTYDPGPVPPPAVTDPLFQSIEPYRWTRVLLPYRFEPADAGHRPGTPRQPGPIWVKNCASEPAYITIGVDGTVGLQGGEGFRWLIRTGPHPDLERG